MKIAVIGGGLFGCTAAIHAARAGHHVTIFERAGALMQCASGINQLRLHGGLHYPRSPETVAECRNGIASFRREYGSALIVPYLQYYVIAKEGSRVSAAAYRAFCDRHSLDATWLYGAGCPFINYDAVETTFAVREPRIDLYELRSIIVHRVAKLGIQVRYEPATRALRERFDRIVIAAYAGTNAVVDMLGLEPDLYQYEVVEKPVLRMPTRRPRGGWNDVGLVVLDGPFCCIDPFAKTGLHLMGHVVHAIHASNTGYWPEVPERLAPLLNRGMVSVNHLAGVTKFPLMQENGERFIPALADAEHLGSMFTVRCVLPHRDETDERPTLVHRLDDQVVRIFSGKLGTAVVAARQALAMIEEREMEAA
jgi:hypothetical protein